MILAMVRPILLARIPFTTGKTELRESMTRHELFELFGVAAIYVVSFLRDWIPGSK